MAFPPVTTRTTWTDAPPDGSATVINNAELQQIYDKIDDVITRIVTVRKNSAGSDFQRPRVNFIEGTNVTLTVADDSGNKEVDITIAAAGLTAFEAYDVTLTVVSDALTATGSTDILNVTEIGVLMGISQLVTTTLSGATLPIFTLDITVDGGTLRTIKTYDNQANWAKDGFAMWEPEGTNAGGGNANDKMHMNFNSRYAVSLKVSHNGTQAITTAGIVNTGVLKGLKL